MSSRRAKGRFTVVGNPWRNAEDGAIDKQGGYFNCCRFPNGQRLRIDAGASRYLAWFVFAAHGIGMLAILLLSIPFPAKLVLGFLASFSLVYAMRDQVWKTASRAIVAVEYEMANGWTLHTRSGVEISARLLASSFVQSWLVILNFRACGPAWHTLIVPPDAADKDSLRNLRVHLRIHHTSSGDQG